MEDLYSISPLRTPLAITKKQSERSEYYTSQTAARPLKTSGIAREHLAEAEPNRRQ